MGDALVSSFSIDVIALRAAEAEFGVANRRPLVVLP
jgi:hypothetical protein